MFVCLEDRKIVSFHNHFKAYHTVTQKFSIVSELLQGCIGFALLRFIIGPKTTCATLPNDQMQNLTIHDLITGVFARF